MRVRLLSIGVAAVLAANLCACSDRDAKPTVAPTVKLAPDFSLPTLDGKQVTLSGLKGKVVLLDFWATWCGPCKESLPHLEHLATDPNLAAQGLVVYAVNEQDPKDQIAKFIQKNGYTFTVAMDENGKAGSDYDASSIPKSVVIGRDGTIKAVFLGYDKAEGGKGVDEAVEKALAEK